MNKLTAFTYDGETKVVQYVGEQHVKVGVTCELYTFVNDDTKDLAVIHVAAGQKTPLQKVLKGSKTIEGFLKGNGSLTVRKKDGSAAVYRFPSAKRREVSVERGEIMQWQATEDLAFYEICEPPYEEGRFENLAP